MSPVNIGTWIVPFVWFLFTKTSYSIVTRWTKLEDETISVHLCSCYTVCHLYMFVYVSICSILVRLNMSQQCQQTCRQFFLCFSLLYPSSLFISNMYIHIFLVFMEQLARCFIIKWLFNTGNHHSLPESPVGATPGCSVRPSPNGANNFDKLSPNWTSVSSVTGQRSI